MQNDNKFKTIQESFWAGGFGDDYIRRNQGDELLASNLDFFAKALRGTARLDSCIEFGANVGMNLKALKLLYPKLRMHGVEINNQAANQLRETIPEGNIHNTSILDFYPSETCDLAIIKGVLIHINPDVLPVVYGRLIDSTRRYLLVAEYYNPTPVSIPYRGHSDRLFKRDFAGEMMDIYPQLQLIDYGFAYHRDPSFPQDDITWFLLEKR